ncbi:MAG: hypothetical protein RR565_06605 [Erysipelothrix sp.]
MNKSIMNYLEDFEQYGIIQDEAIETGEYKKANATVKKLEKILLVAKEDSESEKFYLTILKKSKSKSAIITACSQMLKLNINAEVARNELEKIANSSEKSMSRMSAKMFLQEWDKGNIKPIV